jgi:hypothetical protein
MVNDYQIGAAMGSRCSEIASAVGDEVTSHEPEYTNPCPRNWVEDAVENDSVDPGPRHFNLDRWQDNGGWCEEVLDIRGLISRDENASIECPMTDMPNTNVVGPGW